MRKKPNLTVVPRGEQVSRVKQYILDGAQSEAARFEEQCEHLCQKCESPIEELLAVALYSYSRIMPERMLFLGTSALPKEPEFDETAFVYQQVEIGQYRVDFAIWDASLPFNHTPPRLMIVECDGHDFHEKTKEQARRDKRRDRYFQSLGYKVLRFTGSEIWADPDGVADEIFDQLARYDSWRHREQ